jgi:hypothetical protein
MAVEMRAPGGAVAGAAAPSVGDVLRFAAYVAGLVGEDRVTRVLWQAKNERLAVQVSDAMHGDVLAHLLGLDARGDHGREDSEDSFSCWEGASGGVSVFLTAPLALGGLPQTRWEYELGKGVA